VGVAPIPLLPTPSLQGRGKIGDPLKQSPSHQGRQETGEQLNLTPSSLRGVGPSGPEALMGEGGGGGEISQLFKSNNVFWIILSFFGFGLLLSLTPCVFPMIPIISGIIIAQGSALTKKQAFLLSLTYVLGMALTYSAAGVAAAFSGRLLSVALQNPWVLSAFALIFVLLAFSMFGFYELQVPSFIQSKLTTAGNTFKGGNYLGVFFMGLFSAIIIGPCVTAPLAGALLFIGQTHNVWLGGSALFSLSLGMGLPLLIVGTSAGALLPKAGAWMNAVKAFFGVLMIAVALWLISPIISETIQLFLWGILLIISSVYLSVLDPLPLPSSGWAKFRKGIGLVALILGISLLIGALMGGRDLLQPLSGISQKSKGSFDQQPFPAPVPGPTFETITNLGQIETHLKAAQGQAVMLFVSADWCVSCKEMEGLTFKNLQVQERLRRLKILKADVTKSDEEALGFLRKLGLFGPPAVLFFDQTGSEVLETRVVGFQKPDVFLQTLQKVLGET
ncbi:MAG: thiol:disulfide interchange protein, partial [Desulfobacca sp.]|nr:thiol:disulfide interchange protein [Desulfobacca sp.]